MKTVILSAIIMTFLAAGCTQTNEGYVVDRTYHPAYTYTTYQYISTGRGTGYTVPVTTYVPESWSATLSGWQYNPNTLSYDQKNAYLPISRELYDTCCIGDWMIVTNNPGQLNAINFTVDAAAKYPPGTTWRIPPAIADEILKGRG